jgi:hypothetical protein
MADFVTNDLLGRVCKLDRMTNVAPGPIWRGKVIVPLTEQQTRQAVKLVANQVSRMEGKHAHTVSC